MEGENDNTGSQEAATSHPQEDAEGTSSSQNINQQIKTRIEQHLKSAKLIAGQHFKEIRNKVQSLSASGGQEEDGSSAHKQASRRGGKGEERDEGNDTVCVEEGIDLEGSPQVEEVTPNLGIGEHHLSPPMSDQSHHQEMNSPPIAPVAKLLAPPLPIQPLPSQPLAKERLPVSQITASPLTQTKHQTSANVTEPVQQNQNTVPETAATYMISPPPPPPPSPRPAQFSPSAAASEIQTYSPRAGRHLAVHRKPPGEHMCHQEAMKSAEATVPQTSVSAKQGFQADVKIFINDDSTPLNLEPPAPENQTSVSTMEQASSLENKSLIPRNPTTPPPLQLPFEEHQNHFTKAGIASTALGSKKNPENIGSVPLSNANTHQESDLLDNDDECQPRMDENDGIPFTSTGQQWFQDTKPAVAPQDIPVGVTTSTLAPGNEPMVQRESELTKLSRKSKDRPKIHKSKGKKKSRNKQSPGQEALYAVTKTPSGESIGSAPGSRQNEIRENATLPEVPHFVSCGMNDKKHPNSLTLEQPAVSLCQVSQTACYSSSQGLPANVPFVDTSIPPPYNFLPPVPPRSPLLDSGREPVYRETTVPLQHRPAPTAPPLYSRSTPPSAPTRGYTEIPTPRPIAMTPPPLLSFPSYYTSGSGYSTDAPARPFSHYQATVTQTPPNGIYQPDRRTGSSDSSQKKYRYFPSPESQGSKFLKSLSNIGSFIGSKTGRLRDDVARKLSSSVSETDRPRQPTENIVQEEPGAFGGARNMDNKGRDNSYEADHQLTNDEILIQMICCCCWPVGLTARILTKLNPSGPRQGDTCVSFISSHISTASVVLGVSMYIVLFLLMPFIFFISSNSH